MKSLDVRIRIRGPVWCGQPLDVHRYRQPAVEMTAESVSSPPKLSEHAVVVVQQETRLAIKRGDVADPECLPRDASLAWVLNLMPVGGFRHVPAVDQENRPVLIVSVRDAVQFLVDSFSTEILNLPPEYGKEHCRTRDGA